MRVCSKECEQDSFVVNRIEHVDSKAHRCRYDSVM